MGCPSKLLHGNLTLTKYLFSERICDIVKSVKIQSVF